MMAARVIASIKLGDEPIISNASYDRTMDYFMFAHFPIPTLFNASWNTFSHQNCVEQ